MEQQQVGETMDYFNKSSKCTVLKPLDRDSEGLLIVQAQGKDLDAYIWIKENKLAIEKELLKHGGILLRGFPVHSVSEFNKIVQIFCPNLLDYVYRSTPRTKLGGKIYTATEYPKDRSIPFHNENSYTTSWPQMLFFYSAVVAIEGGETPIADSRRVYNSIDPIIRNEFERRDVQYVRNYTSGIDLSWQEVFQTNQREYVNKYCQENHIEFQWRDAEPQLTTKQICKSTISHPISGERVWFNQAHLFHISSLAMDDRISLTNAVGEKYLPRNAFYGDGTSIDPDVLNHIREAYEKEKIKFKWHKGDILILDNILMAHSREPFEGQRKVAVAMGSSYSMLSN